MAEPLLELATSKNLDSYAWVMAGGWNEEPKESSDILASASQLGTCSLPSKPLAGKEPKTLTGLPLVDPAGAANRR